MVKGMNPGGLLLEDHLWAVPTRIRSVATQGIHHGAGTALAMAQLRSGHDLRRLEPGFSVDVDPRV